MMRLRRLNADRLGCAGNAAAQFAMILPVLLLMVMGAFEAGRLYWIQNTIQYAAEQTGRCVLGKTPGDGVTVVDTSSSAPSGTACPYTANTGGLQSVTWDSTTNTAAPVTCFTGSLSKCQKVKLTYAFTFNGILSGLMRMVSRGSAPSGFTLVGLSQVPVS